MCTCEQKQTHRNIPTQYYSYSLWTVYFSCAVRQLPLVCGVYWAYWGAEELMEAELQSRTISGVPGPAGSRGFKSPAWLSISTWAHSVAWLGVNLHYEGSLSAPVLTNKYDTFSGKYIHKNTATILVELCFLCLSWHNQPINYIIIYLR